MHRNIENKRTVIKYSHKYINQQYRSRLSEFGWLLIGIQNLPKIVIKYDQNLWQRKYPSRIFDKEYWFRVYFGRQSAIGRTKIIVGNKFVQKAESVNEPRIHFGIEQHYFSVCHFGRRRKSEQIFQRSQIIIQSDCGRRQRADGCIVL